MPTPRVLSNIVKHRQTRLACLVRGPHRPAARDRLRADGEQGGGRQPPLLLLAGAQPDPGREEGHRGQVQPRHHLDPQHLQVELSTNLREVLPREGPYYTGIFIILVDIKLGCLSEKILKAACHL